MSEGQAVPVPVSLEGARAEIQAFLLETVRSANKAYSRDVPCEKCRGFKHRVEFVVPDVMARIRAAQELLDRLEGRPAARPPKAPKIRAGSLEGLSDDELDALIAQEEGAGDGET